MKGSGPKPAEGLVLMGVGDQRHHTGSMHAVTPPSCHREPPYQGVAKAVVFVHHGLDWGLTRQTERSGPAQFDWRTYETAKFCMASHEMSSVVNPLK